MTKFSFIPDSGIATVGVSSLVLRANIRNAGKALRAIDEIVCNMYDRHLFPQDKFVRIGLLFLYGIKTDLKPRYERIDRSYKDLPIAVELNTEILKWANINSFELLKEIFLIATCEAVLDVLRKYKLPTDSVEKVRREYGDIPETIEKCEEWVRLHNEK